jgi:beta-hydroxylase
MADITEKLAPCICREQGLFQKERRRWPGNPCRACHMKGPKEEGSGSMLSIACMTARRAPALKFTKKAFKRVVPLSLGIYLIPKILVFYFCCGLVDVLRNKTRNLATLDRYFAGNGIFTWLLSPFNLLMDVLALPFRNKGIYELTDLPEPYQDEIRAVVDAAHRRNIVGELQAKVNDQQRGMMFFKWYGKNLRTSIEVPEFHEQYRYIRTIGVSIFNKKQSTGMHFGPLRVTLRVLYNINTIHDKNVYIQVGNRINYWQENKLFIFDDTLQHQSCNESNAVRYCLFVDILRPSLLSGATSAILSCVRLVIARFNFIFYQKWTFIR